MSKDGSNSNVIGTVNRTCSNEEELLLNNSGKHDNSNFNASISFPSASEISALTYPTFMQTTITSEVELTEENLYDDGVDITNDNNKDEELLSSTSSISLFSTNTKEEPTSLSLHASMVDTSCCTNTLTITSDTMNMNENNNSNPGDVANSANSDNEKKDSNDDVIISSIISEMEKSDTTENNNNDKHDPYIFHNIGSSLLQNNNTVKKADSDSIPSFAKCSLCYKILIGSHVLDCPVNHVMCYTCVIEVIDPDEIVDNDWMKLSTQQPSNKICPVCKNNQLCNTYTNIIPCPSLDKAINQTILALGSSPLIIQNFNMRINQYENYLHNVSLQKQKDKFIQEQYDIENRIMERQRQRRVFWKESIAFFVTVCVTVAFKALSSGGGNDKNRRNEKRSDDSKGRSGSGVVGKNRNRNCRMSNRK